MRFAQRHGHDWLSLFAVACDSQDNASAGAAGTAGAAGSAGAGGGPDAGVPEAAPPDAADTATDGPPTTGPAAEPATTLPLEVLGAPGAGVEVSLHVDVADLEAVQAGGNAHLVLTLHNVVAPESAEVRINDG